MSQKDPDRPVSEEGKNGKEGAERLFFHLALVSVSHRDLTYLGWVPSIRLTRHG